MQKRAWPSLLVNFLEGYYDYSAYISLAKFSYIATLTCESIWEIHLADWAKIYPVGTQVSISKRKSRVDIEVGSYHSMPQE